MGDEMNAGSWIYSKLTTDETLVSLHGGRVYRDIAPETNAQYPIVRFQFVDSVPVNNQTKDRILDTERWLITVVDKSNSYSKPEQIADRIRELLHKSTSTGVIGCTVEQFRQRHEVVQGVIYKSVNFDLLIMTQM